MTEFLVDLASYQEGINLGLVANSGFKLANIKTSQGNSYRWSNAGKYADIARGLNYTIGTFHWLDNSTSGAEQARIAFQGMKDIGGPNGMFHQCDCEDNATEAIWRDYVNAMQDLLGRHIVTYTGDWWWTAAGRNWYGADLTPYLWAAPNNGYLASYPGDVSPQWYAGYGGWTDYSVLQYAVQPISGAGGGDVSKSAIRDSNVISALTGSGGVLMALSDTEQRELLDGIRKLVGGWPATVTADGKPDGRPIGIHVADMWRYLVDGKGAYEVGHADPNGAASGIYLDQLLKSIRDSRQPTGTSVDQGKLAADIAKMLIASNTNGLTQADHDAVVADVKKALREGVA